MRRLKWAAVLVVAAGMAQSLMAWEVMAKPMAIRPVGAGAGRMVDLPYRSNDSSGNMWEFYQGGWLRQQSNGMMIYSQGAQLYINGNNVGQNSNQARLDEKTGEAVFENLQPQGVQVTRRMLVLKEENYVRVIDIVKNPGKQDVTVALMINTSINYGVQSSQTVPDPKGKGADMAWVAQTSANNMAVIEVLNGTGAKTTATINAPQGNNYMQATWNLTVPGGKEVAVMHLHGVHPGTASATNWLEGLKESKLMASIPAPLRKIIANFRSGISFVGDLEILRGEVLDVVELRGGDQMRGTLKEQAFKLKTFYGPVELSADKVIGLINVGDFRPRQLLITRDGEIFGGELEKRDLSIELSSGQLAAVPLSQVSRMGYRKKANEPDEWIFDKPVVLMRTGERICVAMPTKELEVLTRYGMLKLKAEAVASITFQAEEHGVHQVQLVDGSSFAGLVTAEAFEMTLADSNQPVKFPVSSLARLQLSSKPTDIEAGAATLKLANEDLLVGPLVGGVKLDTAFSTLNIDSGEVARLTHSRGATQDVQVNLWDQTAVSGQLQESQLTCRTSAGVEITVPVILIEEYIQPQPRPGSLAKEGILKLVADLNSEDWQVREEAQKKLTGMGTVVISVLKEARAKQSPEAQQRIDQVLKAMEKGGATGAGAALNPNPGGVDIDGPVFIQRD